MDQMCWMLIRVTEAGMTGFQKLFLPVSWLSACSPGFFCASLHSKKKVSVNLCLCASYIHEYVWGCATIHNVWS